MMGWSTRCLIPSFVKIGPPDLEKKIFEGFLPYMGVACDPDAAKKLSFPLPYEAPHKNLALIGQAVSEKKIFEHCERRTDGRMTTDGRRTMSIL